MTVPEATIVTGTANNTAQLALGRLLQHEQSIPADDCTFWFVSQYYAATNAWSTRIASAAFPPGAAPASAPCTTCVTRPALQPAPRRGDARQQPDHGELDGHHPDAGRVRCSSVPMAPATATGLYRPLAAAPGTTTSYADTTVLGGLAYSYRVRSAAGRRRESARRSSRAPAVSATATGTCTLKPSFARPLIAIGERRRSATAGSRSSWAPASSSCPLAPSVRYNIYRGTVPDFVPSAANRIATCVVGTSYLDTDNLSSGTTYYYVVHAEDGTTGNGGACGGGNEELERRSSRSRDTVRAPGVQAAPRHLDGRRRR